jgi:cytidine deaminase
MAFTPEPISQDKTNSAPADVMKRLAELEAAAAEAAQGAYAPYSGFQVGAAVLTSAGEIVTGANVENASYGLTMCAERVAIFDAVTSARDVEIRALAVVQADRVPAAPCGACRQVIFEHGPEASVLYVSEHDQLKVVRIADLLPDGFWFPSGYGRE